MAIEKRQLSLQEIQQSEPGILVEFDAFFKENGVSDSDAHTEGKQ